MSVTDTFFFGGKQLTLSFHFFLITKQLIFLSEWPFSLFVEKTCLRDRISLEIVFACGGLINLRITFGNSFSTQKEFPKCSIFFFFAKPRQGLEGRGPQRAPPGPSCDGSRAHIWALEGPFHIYGGYRIGP